MEGDALALVVLRGRMGVNAAGGVSARPATAAARMGSYFCPLAGRGSGVVDCGRLEREVGIAS